MYFCVIQKKSKGTSKQTATIRPTPNKSRWKSLAVSEQERQEPLCLSCLGIRTPFRPPEIRQIWEVYVQGYKLYSRHVSRAYSGIVQRVRAILRALFCRIWQEHQSKLPQSDRHPTRADERACCGIGIHSDRHGHPKEPCCIGTGQERQAAVFSIRQRTPDRIHEIGLFWECFVWGV